MKRTSMWSGAALAAALIVAPALAQGPMMGMHGGGMGMGGPGGGGPGVDHGRMLERLATLLDLTDAQKSAATSLFATAKSQAEPVAAQLKTGHEAVAAAVKANKSDAEIETLTAANGRLMGQLAGIHAKAQRAFYALLTPAQREKLDTLHDQMPGRRGPGQRGNR